MNLCGIQRTRDLRRANCELDWLPGPSGRNMGLRSAIFAATVVICGAFPLQLSAHHGFASYDETREVTLKGTVTEFDWSNPHTEIYFDVKNANGNVVHWGCETLSPTKLSRAGWSKDALKPGDRITITLVAARNGAPVGFLHRLIFDNTGKNLFVDKLSQ
jgi:hypothetical protein